MGKKLKPLNQDDFNIKIVKDLGMVGNGGAKKRKAIFECPECKKHRKLVVGTVKHYTKKGNLNKCNSCKYKTHGDARTPLYRAWSTMKYRKNICEKWDDYIIFKEWALNNGYKSGLNLILRDKKGIYEPDNCILLVLLELVLLGELKEYKKIIQVDIEELVLIKVKGSL